MSRCVSASNVYWKVCIWGRRKGDGERTGRSRKRSLALIIRSRWGTECIRFSEMRLPTNKRRYTFGQSSIWDIVPKKITKIKNKKPVARVTSSRATHPRNHQRVSCRKIMFDFVSPQGKGRMETFWLLDKDGFEKTLPCMPDCRKFNDVTFRRISGTRGPTIHWRTSRGEHRLCWITKREESFCSSTEQKSLLFSCVCVGVTLIHINVRIVRVADSPSPPPSLSLAVHLRDTFELYALCKPN